MASSVEYSGWGEGPWGYVPWGLDAFVVAVDGVGGVGSVGDVTTTGTGVVEPLGVQADSGVGDVGIAADSRALVSGVSATLDVGSVTAQAAADVESEGVQATGQIGDVHVGVFVWIDLTGVSAAFVAGSVTVSIPKTVAVSGVQGTFEASRPLVWGLVDDRQTSGWQNVPVANTPEWVEISNGSAVHWAAVAA